MILLGTIPAGLSLSGLVIRHDYLRELFPQNTQYMAMFVRPERAREARRIAELLDEQFRSGAAPTISAPLYEFRQSSARDASTVRLIIVGALAISFFTLVLIVTNALVQSVRERIGEMAVMQALGIQRATIVSLVLAEALLLFAAGALLGLVLSNLGFTYEIAGMRSNSDALPMHTIVTAIACVVACAFLSVLAPWRELFRCALGYLMLLGIASSIPPCVRALRCPIPVGLFAR